MAMDFARRFGPWALVTGAAEGLGLAYARQLAKRGLHLCLVDVQRAKLEAVADELRDAGVTVATSVMDLAQADEQALAAIHAQHDVGLLVHCAAICPIGDFTKVPSQEHLRTLDINGRGTLLLAHTCARVMSERGRGAMLLVSSGSALTGAPLIAHYAATKAYIEVLGMGLAAELAPRGVDVLVCCPGMIRTAATQAHPPKLSAAPWVKMSEPEEVVERSLAALGKQLFCVPAPFGERMGLQLLSRLLPRRLAAKLLNNTMHRLYPQP